MSAAGQILRRILVTALLCAALFGVHGTLVAGHGMAARPAAGLGVSPNAGPPGSLVNLTAPPGSLPAGAVAVVNFQDATAAYPGIPIGQGTVNSDGSINFPVNVLGVAAAGLARIFVTANGVTVSNTFTVQPGLTVNPPSAPRGAVVQVTGSGFSPNALITIQVGDQPATALGTEPIIANLFGTFTTYLVIPRLPPGLVTMTVSDSTFTATTPFLVTASFGPPTPLPTVTFPITGTGTVSPTATPPIPVATSTPTGTPAPAPSTLYFAEGYTGQAATNGAASFDESLNILNPGSNQAPVTITYYIQGAAAPMVVTHTVAPRTVLRESVNADVGPNKLVAAQVSSPGTIYASRTLARIAASGARLDGSTAQGVATPGTSWGFPEGYTGATFQEYLTLLDPGQTAATVTITLAPQASSAAGARVLHLTVPPRSRVTANITALNAGNSAQSVGMLVSSDAPIVAERVMYYGAGSGSGKFGSTVSAGITSPATILHIGGLSSGGAAPLGSTLVGVGDQPYVTLLNPALTGSPVSVTASFADAVGRLIGGPSRLTVAPGTRQTLTLNPILGTHLIRPLSVSLVATGPIEAEAAQYFGGSPNLGSHPGIAFPARATLGTDVFFSDLSTALPDSTPISRVVYLYNPGVLPLEVSATYFGAGSGPVGANYGVPAGGITTVTVNGDARGVPAGPLGAEFKVSGGSGGFLAYTVGRTADGLFAAEDIAAPAS